MPRKNPGTAAGPGHGWNLDNVRELIDLLTERDIAEFEMEKDGLRVRVKRGRGPKRSGAPVLTVDGLSPSPSPGPGPVDPQSAGLEASRTPQQQEGPPAEAPGGESTDGLHVIKSPIVGTFYSSPSPTAPAFVKPGDLVHVGQVLCIIEAMKLMNEIESEADGEVVRIYVENGQPVEYGQGLFAIRPSYKK